MPPPRVRPKIRLIHQTLLDAEFPAIEVHDEITESCVSEDLFNGFFEGGAPLRFVGIAPVYSDRGSLIRLALAMNTKVLIIQFAAKGKGKSAYLGREILQAQVLCNPDVTLVAFDMNKLALALFADQGLRVLNGVDVQSACATEREPLAAIELAAKDVAVVNKDNVRNAFERAEDSRHISTSVAQQAWVAQCLVSFDGMEERFRAAKVINTLGMEEMALRIFTQVERGENRLEFAQATYVAHEFTTVGARRETLQIRGERFQNRIREDGVKRLKVRDTETGIEYTVDGKVDSSFGRNATIRAASNIEGRVVQEIITHGRDGPTLAEIARSRTVLQGLQGQSDPFEAPFLKYIFRPSEDFTWPDTFPVLDTIPPIITKRPLNESQERAVQHMLSNDNDTRLTIIQGPPGTGKTTVIAAFVLSAVAAGASGIWLMAQSNIAVKNIAEKLVDVGFNNWKLLVSNDFHVGWHEHLYGQVAKNVIRSGEFRSARSKIQGVPVILCTLSMLSNPRLSIFTTANPIKTMVLDEASQITLGSYVAPLQSFSSTIHKICMIGDDKQLPPFGAEADENIQSIFEVKHLRPSILFLSIQYRMPPLIGDVVSDVVYEGQLQSNPEHPVPVTQPCCWLVHVADSQERRFDTSWHNPAEREIVLKLAQKLNAEEKQYAIITPYDAQRSNLEKELKDSGLPWEDKCFNVDSFQGNERDYIIVSLVRSAGLGFLNDERRTNVMLTRCKKGMYIVTNWHFVTNKAEKTLVGRMAAAWGDEAWVNPEHITIEA